jgi:t-SNARE complex subunit (syntaxin)
MLILESSVAEWHQLVLDFALLTEQQGELLEQIEFQVKQAGDHVEEANMDAVHRAIERQKSVQKKQWQVSAMSCCMEDGHDPWHCICIGVSHTPFFFS